MTSTKSNPLAALESVWRDGMRDFLHYLVEVAEPIMVTEDDHRVMDVLRRFHQEEEELGTAITEYLIEAGWHPVSGAFQLNDGTFNYMQPTQFLPSLVEQLERDVARIERVHDALAGGEDLSSRRVRYFLEDLLKLQKDHYGEAKKLAASLVSDAGAEVEEEEEVGEVVGVGGEFPWHDEDLGLDDRMKLAKGRGLFEKLYAAMAQTDCTACGYDCEGYARAIADGEDKDLTKCAPGELETQEMLESLMKEAGKL